MSPLQNIIVRNINLYPSASLSIHLRTDSPYVDWRCVGNLGYPVWSFHLHYVTHTNIFTWYLQQRSPFTFSDIQNAPLPFINKSTSSVYNLAPLNFRRKFAWPVSYYALLKEWLLQANLPVVQQSHILSHSYKLGTLDSSLGCFPLDNGTYLSCLTPDIIYMVFEVYQDLLPRGR